MATTAKNTYRPTVTAECVSDGHPDKICDQIADALLDACLAQDPGTRHAAEVAMKGTRVVLHGEVTARADVDRRAIVRGVLEGIGHGEGRWGLDLGALDLVDGITRQSVEIAAAVDGDGALGAGDQGIAVGYACDETPSMMPLAYELARALMLRQREVRRTPAGAALGPDAKAQVTVAYEGGRPAAVEAVVVSSQHRAGVALERVRELLLEEVVRPVVPAGLVDRGTRFLLNPGGSFEEGGPVADSGQTGRKVVADSYGPVARHGGGAYSGKDGTKVDRSAAYMARRLAKAIVAAGLARRAELQVAYAIGRSDPVALALDTFATGVMPDEALLAGLWEELAGWCRVDRMVETLELRRPGFLPVAAFGHFGRTDLDLPWERPLALEGAGIGRA